MSQINADAALPVFSPADCEGIYTMSNGALVAILRQPAAGTADQYAVSTDSGATWALHTFPIFPGLSVTLWRTMAATSVYVQDANVLHQWGVEAPGSLNDNGFYHRALPFDPSANTFGIAGATGGYRYDASGGGIQITPTGVAAAIQGSGLTGVLNGHWFVAFSTGSNLYITGLYSDPSFLGPYSPVSLNYSHGAIGDMHLRYVPGSTYDLILSFTDLVKHQLIVIPLHWTGSAWNNTTYTFEAPYTFTGTDVGHTPIFDASGNLDFIIRNGTNLYALKRTGTNSYQSTIPLYTGVNQTTLGVPVSFDPITGNAMVFFESTANRSTGEIYAVERSGGIWSAPSLVAGGTTDGYSQPLCARNPSGSNTPLIYKHGAGVDFLNLPLAGAPFTPTVSSPSGYIGTITPILAAPYINSAPSDLIGFQEWQVERTSDLASMLATGKVATTSPSLLYAGSALSFGVQYQARVRYWDSISAAGAGTPSGWSAWSLFTPIHGPVGTINSVTSAGATASSSPSTLGSPALSANVTYTQTDGHSASQYRLKAYSSDMVTLVAASPMVLGAIANGTTFNTALITLLALLNSTTYYLAIEATDSVTGVVADGPLWQVNTSWVPPPSPTGFSVINNDDLGTVTGSWTNDVSAASNNLYYRESDTVPWILAPKSGTLFTSFTANPPTQTPYDYKVTAVSVAGIESLPDTATVTLGGRGVYEWSVILQDLVDPTLIAWMGAPDTWDDLKWTGVKDRDVYQPLMGRFQKSSWGVVDWETIPLKFYIFGEYWLKNGSISPYRQDVKRLKQMWENGEFLQYRDPKGKIKIVEMTAFSDAPADDFNDHVEFTLEEMDIAVMVIT